MKKKVSWWQCVLLAAFVIGLAFGAFQVENVGNHLQYLVLPPEQEQASGDSAAQVKPNQPVANAVKRLQDAAEEWDTTTMERWTVGGVIESASLRCSAGSASDGARLELVGQHGLLVRPLFLLDGRLFYPDEIEDGAHVMLLDQQLAMELFQVPLPLGRKVTLDGAGEYEVVGVVRHSKRVGDLKNSGAYIPLNSVIDTNVSLDALFVEAIPRQGVGASVSFKSIVEHWSDWTKNATFIDLGKEGMGAKLWLRVLLFVAGMTASLRFIRWLNGRVAYYSKRYRQRLQQYYALRLLPELIGVILLFVLGYGASAGLIALLMAYIIEPVYTFTEWIPEILVEWADIAKAFWRVWQEPAVMVELRSPELLRLHWLDLLIKGCSAGAAGILALIYARSRALADEMRESLTGLYREGVLVSVIRTTRPIAMGEMGYIPCEETDAWQPAPMHPRRHRRRGQSVPMMRIINAERILEQLAPGKLNGSFVIEITDDKIEQNNRRWKITCMDSEKTMEEVSRDWDIQVPVETLARLVYGGQKFTDFLENNAGYDMKMRSPAMDGLFDQRLPITRGVA